MFLFFHPGVCVDFLRCFSLIENTTKIFNTNVTPKMITSVNGIRVISMFWIILGHTFLNMLTSGLLGEYSSARGWVRGCRISPVMETITFIFKFKYSSNLNMDTSQRISDIDE